MSAQIFQRRHYSALAETMGTALAQAEQRGGGKLYNDVYECVYLPLVEKLRADNPDFIVEQFSYECALAIGRSTTPIVCDNQQVSFQP